MNQTNTKLHLTVIRVGLLMMTLFLTSQMNAQFYLSNFDKFGLGLGSRSLEPLVLELRVGTNNDLDNTRLEVAAMYQFDDQSFHTISAGVAFALDPFRDYSDFGFTMLAQLEIFPIPDYRRFALFIELGPEFHPDSDQTGLRHNWGFRYYFADND